MSLELTSASVTVTPAPPVPEPTPAVQAEHAILQAVVRAATEFLRSTDLKESLHTLLADIGATHARFALQTGPGAFAAVRVP